jgi:fucose 4-O-acetylase-like acetyltransferase
MQRDDAIDLARGIAIVTMVCANVAPFALVDPHPLWFRLIGSFAAPLFISLAGMMIALTATQERHGLSYFVQRGGTLVALGMLIDMAIWHHWPWFSFDVLYLIGIGTPLVYCSLRVPWIPRAVLAIGMIAASPWLRSFIGYPENPEQPSLVAEANSVIAALSALVNNIVADGFFPLFPWLGVMILGSVVGNWRWSATKSARRFIGPKAIAGALGLLALGVVCWRFDPGTMFVRGGFSEIFYPPTTGFIALAFGVVACVLVASDYLGRYRVLKPARRMGRASLFVYWWHIVFIDIAVRNWIGPQPVSVFALTYAFVMVALYDSVIALQSQRQLLAKFPLPLRFLLA